VTERSIRKLRKELNSGTVSLVLLAVVAGAEQPMYGYQIAKQLEATAGGGMPVKQGALYPVLRSLEAQGLLTSNVEPSISGPPRRYYRATAEGRHTLEDWRQEWTVIRDFVDGWLEGDDD
jgi:PadR family transcriptional regulator PadR